VAVYRVKVEGKEYEVSVSDAAAGGAEVSVEGETFHVEPVGRPAPVAPSVAHSAGAAPAAPIPRAAAPMPPAAGGSGTIAAPIPGVITKVLVAVGDSVKAGQVVLKLEAMKMENDISTPVAGTVKQVAVASGAEVSDGQLLLVIE